MSGDKVVGFRIEINGTDDQIRKMSAIRAAMVDLRSEILRAGVAKKQGQLTEEEYQQAVIRLNQQLKTEQTELNRVTTEVQRANQVFRAQSGSMAELNQALNLNKERYRQLSEAERNNAQVGGVLLQTINQQDQKLKQLDATIGNHQRNVGNYAGALNRMATGLTTQLKAMAGGMIAAFSIGAVKSFLTHAVDGYDKYVVVQEKLKSVLKATGNTVGLTADQLEAYAAKMSKATRMSKTEIMDAQAKLLTFRSISGGMFNEIIKIAGDMTTVLGTDLQGAIIQLGKAFNSPEVGLTALRRAGVSFTKEETDRIKTLEKSGRLYEAQAMIMKELKLEFEGTAEAVSKVGKGPLIQMEKQFSAFQKKIGESVATGGAFKGLISALTSFGTWLKNNTSTVIALAKAIGIFLTALVTYKLVALAAAAATKIWNDAKAVQLMWTKQNTAATRANIVATEVQTGATIVQAGATEAATVAQQSLNTAIKSNPFGLILSIIVAVGIAIYELVTALGKAEDGYTKFSKNLNQELGGMNAAFTMLKQTNAGTKERAEAIKLVNEKYGEYLPYLLTEKSSLKEIEAAQRSATQALMENIAMKSQEEQLKEVMDKYAENIKEYNDKIINDVEEQWGTGAAGIMQAKLNEVANRLKDIKLYGESFSFQRETMEGAKELASILSGGSYSPTRWAEALQDMTREYQKQQAEINKVTAFYKGYINTIQAGTKAKKDFTATDPDKEGEGDTKADDALKNEQEAFDKRMNLIDKNNEQLTKQSMEAYKARMALLDEGITKSIAEESIRYQQAGMSRLNFISDTSTAIEEAMEEINEKERKAKAKGRQLSEEDIAQREKLQEQYTTFLRISDEEEIYAEQEHQKAISKILKDATEKQLSDYLIYLQGKEEMTDDEALLYGEVVNAIKAKQQAELDALAKSTQETIAEAQRKHDIHLDILKEETLDAETEAKKRKDIELDLAKAKYEALLKEYELRIKLGTFTEAERKKMLQDLGKLKKEIETTFPGETQSLTGGGFGGKVDKWLAKQIGCTEGEAARIRNSVMNLMTSISKMILDQQKQEIEQRLAADIKYYETRANKELEKLQWQKENGLITEAQYNAKEKAIQQRLAGEKNAADKKAFEDMKERKQAELWINYAAAVIGLYAENHWIVATVLAALLAVEAGLQSDAIAKQEWTPKYELGGPIHGPSHAQKGVTVEAEGGEVILNKRSMASRDRMTVSGTPYEIASQLNAYKNYGVAFGDRRQHYFGSGGYITPQPPYYSSSTSSLSRTDLFALGSMIIDGMNDKLIVTERDITTTQKKARVRENDITW